MPIRRLKLTKAEQIQDRARAEQLRASGVEIEISEGPKEQDRALEIVLAPPMDCTLYEFKSGMIGFAIRVRLSARTGMTIADCDISTKWDNQIVLQSYPNDLICNLGNVQFERGEVLNHRIESGLQLRRNQLVEGYVLGTGLQRIPTACEDFATAPFEMVFFDQFGDGFRADGVLSILRQARDKNVKAEKGTGLYGGEPPAPSVAEESRLRYLAMIAEEKTGAGRLSNRGCRDCR
jgi:hypothetical protein